jgi:hypothetical protein
MVATSTDYFFCFTALAPANSFIGGECMAGLFEAAHTWNILTDIGYWCDGR